MKIKLCFVLIEIFHFYQRLMEAKGPSSKLPQDVSVHLRSRRVSTTGAEKMVCNQRRTEAGANHFFGLCTYVCTKCCIKCYMSES